MSNRMILNETSYFGPGAIAELIPEITGRGRKNIMVVTDEALIKAHVATKVTALLDENKISYQVYDKIKANPTIGNVQDGVAFCRAMAADVIVAVGGGSVIDTAKAIGIIMTNPEFADVRSLEGAAPTKNRMLPLIAVSTTSGTAAEVTINYVITDEEKHRKFVCVDPHDIPVVAIVDSDLSSSMPAKLCAATGMDALVHAIEGYITKGAWEMTDMLHIKAIEIISESLRDAVKGDRQGREAMALGQYIAGMGFSNVGLGLVHAMAHPLSALYDMPHGLACAVLLAPVLSFNAPATGKRYRAVARALGVEGVDRMLADEYRAAAIEAVENLSHDIGIPKKLAELGIKESDIPRLAQAAMLDACKPGNPRDASLEDVIAIYKSIL